MLNTGFPFLPKAKRTRSQIYHRADRLREVRNRVSHHEPIWDRDMAAAHTEVLETIGWMNSGLANALMPLAPLPGVFAAGHVSYRETAGQLVKL